MSRVLLMGWDGADWRILEPMVEQGAERSRMAQCPGRSTRCRGRWTTPTGTWPYRCG